MNRDCRRALLLCLPTTHYPLLTSTKQKNPASSAGYSHPHLGGSTRSSTLFYPVLVKNLTIGSTSWPSLGITLGRRFFDPTVMPCWLSYPRAICNYTDFSLSVKSPQ